MTSLIVAALAMSACIVGHAQSSTGGQDAQVLVPVGMPMQIKVKAEQDYIDPLVTRYTVTRTVPRGARAGVFVVFMIDSDGRVLPGTEMRLPSSRLTDPMSLATGDRRVAKILVVVESMRMKDGAWLLDTPGRKVQPEDIARNGAKALPKAVFVPSKEMP